MLKINRNINTKLVISNIVLWIKKYATEHQLKSLVIGVSGGIDSAVVSTLCAMTNIKTHCLLLPLNQNKKETEIGEKHVNWLRKTYKNVKYTKIDLSSVFENFKNLTPVDELKDLALANTRSRIRMTTLYQVAQSNEGIVVGTGNKVEDFGVGFFTKYGDGGVDISPIADLYKSEVYNIAKELNILEDIQKARPTDGLWDDGRDDESQLGATYDELEWVMNYIEITPENLVGENLSKRESEVLMIYSSLHTKNKHKMVEIPIFKL